MLFIFVVNYSTRRKHLHADNRHVPTVPRHVRNETENGPVGRSFRQPRFFIRFAAYRWDYRKSGGLGTVVLTRSVHSRTHLFFSSFFRNEWYPQSRWSWTKRFFGFCTSSGMRAVAGRLVPGKVFNLVVFRTYRKRFTCTHVKVTARLSVFYVFFVDFLSFQRDTEYSFTDPFWVSLCNGSFPRDK